MRGMHGGSGERRPAAALGPVGEETLKEFEARYPAHHSPHVPAPLSLFPCVFAITVFVSLCADVPIR